MDQKLRTKRRQIKCQEEMEQARKASDLEQEEDRDEVRAGAGGVVVVAKTVANGAGEVVLRRVRVDSVFVPIVVKKHLMSWEVPVMSRNVPNAERP